MKNKGLNGPGPKPTQPMIQFSFIRLIPGLVRALLSFLQTLAGPYFFPHRTEPRGGSERDWTEFLDFITCRTRLRPNFQLLYQTRSIDFLYALVRVKFLDFIMVQAWVEFQLIVEPVKFLHESGRVRKFWRCRPLINGTISQIIHCKMHRWRHQRMSHGREYN